MRDNFRTIKYIYSRINRIKRCAATPLVEATIYYKLLYICTVMPNKIHTYGVSTCAILYMHSNYLFVTNIFVENDAVYYNELKC